MIDRDNEPTVAPVGAIEPETDRERRAVAAFKRAEKRCGRKPVAFYGCGLFVVGSARVALGTGDLPCLAVSQRSEGGWRGLYRTADGDLRIVEVDAACETVVSDDRMQIADQIAEEPDHG